MKTEDTRPLAQRITQGPYIVTESKLIFCTEGGGWIAMVREGYLPSDEKDANTELIAEAFNVTHETGRTPRQLLERVFELERHIQDLVHKSFPIPKQNTLTTIQKS